MKPQRHFQKKYIVLVYISVMSIPQRYILELLMEKQHITITHRAQETPHSVPVGRSTPKGTKTVAYAHTHPNSNSFSDADIRVANHFGIDAYVVGPNLNLQRYNLTSATTTSLGIISPIALTDEQRAALVSEFRISWDNHVTEGCDFNCGGMEWPTP